MINRCEDIVCSTGPPIFTVEVVDAETGINVFTSNKYDSKNILVTDQGNEVVYSRFISENNLNVIQISPESEKGEKQLKLKLGNDLVIPIEANVREGSVKCYTNYFPDGISAIGYEYEISKVTGAIIIKI